MREFFQGWRRKTGVVTLLFACIFAAGWVRGRWKVDQLFYLTDAQTLHVLYSCPQGIGCTRIREMKAGAILGAERVGMLAIESMNTDCNNWVYPPPEWSEHEWWRQWIGLRTGTQFAESPPSFQERRFWIIPHWLVAVPLTLLSTWLLLSRPRVAKLGAETEANFMGQDSEVNDTPK